MVIMQFKTIRRKSANIERNRNIAKRVESSMQKIKERSMKSYIEIALELWFIIVRYAEVTEMPTLAAAAVSASPLAAASQLAAAFGHPNI